MGFLRKVGRKIKKGAKKLFSSPIGSILGSMAINFMFPGIGQTFNKVFKGATEALGFGAKEAVKEVGKEAVKEIGKETLIQGTKIQDVLNANDLVNTASTSGTTLTETMKKNFIDRPIQAGKDFIDAPFKTTKEFISPDGEFIPDVARSLTTSSLLGAFQGEPDEPFYSKGVSQQLSSVPSQEQVLSTVNSQVPQLNIKSFEQMNQSLYYGVLSPQWLANYNINK